MTTKSFLTKNENWVLEQTIVRYYSQAPIKRCAHYLVLMNVLRFETCCDCGKVMRLKMKKNERKEWDDQEKEAIPIFVSSIVDRERETKIKKLARTRYIWKVSLRDRTGGRFNLPFKRETEKRWDLKDWQIFKIQEF